MESSSSISDQEKTREQLLQELRELRQRLHTETAEPSVREMNEAFGSIADVTREKLPGDLQIEQLKLKAILSGIQMGLLAMDGAGRVLFCNPALLRMHGCGRESLQAGRLQEVFPGWQVQDMEGRILPPDQWPIHRSARGEKLCDLEVLVSHPATGRSYIGCCNANPVIDELGNLLFGIVTIRDITQQKRAEQALRERTETLEEKVAERTVLSERRAHQLQALAVQLIEAEERERDRIAAILHDDLQQVLASARMQFQIAFRGIHEVLAELLQSA